MKELIKSFAEQISQSLKIADKTPLRQAKSEFRNVVISGLGGSGIGGTIIADLAKPISPVPVLVNKEYSLPAFIDKHTLFIASSYSGSTEETLSAAQEAHDRGAHIVCISSGGKLESFAKHYDYDLLKIPGGNPPRACLGYSFSQLIYILTYYNLLPASYYQELKNAVAFLNSQSSEIEQQARSIADLVNGKRLIIYADASMEGVAVRFRQQLNENAKMLAWHHVVPEMNHNELVGWTERDPSLAVIFLRNESDFSRNQVRMEINKKIISDYTSNIFEIYSKGSNIMERILYHIHLEDWISYHLSQLRGVDVMEIRVIDYLKGELAKV